MGCNPWQNIPRIAIDGLVIIYMVCLSGLPFLFAFRVLFLDGTGSDRTAAACAACWPGGLNLVQHTPSLSSIFARMASAGGARCALLMYPPSAVNMIWQVWFLVIWYTDSRSCLKVGVHRALLMCNFWFCGVVSVIGPRACACVVLKSGMRMLRTVSLWLCCLDLVKEEKAHESI